VLQDGTVVRGEGFGAEGETFGEVVFNTSMTGYQEALTDPSYKHQILMMTYPLIGNYGINREDFESDKIHASGFIVKEVCMHPSHFAFDKDIDKFLQDFNVPGMCGVDTRFLTRKIRNFGVMNAILKYPYEEQEIDTLKDRVSRLDSISSFDLVREVTIKKPEFYSSDYSSDSNRIKKMEIDGDKIEGDKVKNGLRKNVLKKTVVLIDCGEKRSILKNLLSRKLDVIVVPADYPAEKILNYEPKGVLVSNGPGDPMKAEYVIKTISELIREKMLVFGICLGHQIISLALGAKTYKLKFGHRGSNQPVKDLKTGRCYITSQNHGFAVDEISAKESNFEITHINLNDNSIEGVKHKEFNVTGIQYHPEAHPGPHDSYYLFDEFVKDIDKKQ